MHSKKISVSDFKLDVRRKQSSLLTCKRAKKTTRQFSQFMLFCVWFSLVRPRLTQCVCVFILCGIFVFIRNRRHGVYMATSASSFIGKCFFFSRSFICSFCVVFTELYYIWFVVYYYSCRFQCTWWFFGSYSRFRYLQLSVSDDDYVDVLPLATTL